MAFDGAVPVQQAASAPPVALPDADRWAAWDRFLETTANAGFMQSSMWAKFRTSVGFEYFAVTVKEGSAIVGGALVGKWTYASGRCFYYIQDGPVLPADPSFAAQVFEEVLARVERHVQADDATVSHLRIEPRWRSLPEFVRGFHPPKTSDDFWEPRNTLCIDLRPTQDDILAQMKPKGRYNVRVAQKHGVVVVEDNSSQGLADFLRIQRRTADRQRIGVKPASYFRNLVSELGAQRRLSLYFAEYRGRRLATALVVFFGERATYFYGGSLVLHRRVMAPYLLHFEIMRASKAVGLEWYDLWGVEPPGAPEHPWHDISIFKRKFGGVAVDLVPTLDHVYDSAAYAHCAGAKPGVSP
jgi:lipid II:glycine glycyltransferase (peptidoglycan interpeptide bridge formation enzyme)